MTRRRFQNEVATGKVTLPVTIILSAVAWISSNLVKTIPEPESHYFFWQALLKWIPGEFAGNILSVLFYGLCGFLMIELNNAYSIIRVRTSLHVSIYFLLIAACPFMHTLNMGCMASLAVGLSIYFLFRSYQRHQPVGHIYHTMLFLGIGSLLFPPVLFFIPVLLLGAFNFKSLTWRTFFAGIVGLSVPYWFLLAHAFFYQEMDMFYAPFIELARFQPIDYSPMGISLIVSVSFIVFLLLVSSVHYMLTSYQDKIRTRAYINFLIYFSFSALLFLLLQPQHTVTLLILLLPVTAFLSGHLFALTTTKISNLFFIITIILLTALAIFNIWMLSYNF